MKWMMFVVLLFVPMLAEATLPPTASNIVSTVRCTLVDTRTSVAGFGGPRFVAGETRGYPVPAGPCPGIPAALGYGLTFTAIGPDANTVQLKAWATGAPMPTTPTLILTRGGTGGNPNNTTPRSAAIEAGPAGSISVQVDVGTDLLIEITSYYVTGLVFNVNAGVGLLGGGTGNITLGIAPGGVGTNELSPAGSSAGQVLMSDGNSVGWRLPPQGTITEVNAGPGLTGGGAKGPVTLAADFTLSGALNGVGSTVARGDHKHYVQTVIVNPLSTATASGTALLAAINGITDASPTKPYLLKIEPGVYDLGTSSLAMKPWVHVEGSGQLVTVITSATNDINFGTIAAASNSELSQLTAVSTQTPLYSIALTMNTVTNFVGHDLTLKGTSTNGSYGAFVSQGGSPILRNVNIDVSSGQYGVIVQTPSQLVLDRSTISAAGTGVSSSGSLFISDSNITATGGASGATGMVVGFSTSVTELRHCVIKVSAAGGVTGIFGGNVLVARDTEVVVSNTVNAAADAVHLIQATGHISNCSLSATSSGGTTNTHAIYADAFSGSYPMTVENSILIAAWSTVYAHDPFAPVRIGASRLEGGPITGFAEICAAVWDENFTFYPSSCP